MASLGNTIVDRNFPGCFPDSLFTNLPLDETINFCADKLFIRKKKVKGMTKIEFKTLLESATNKSFLLFNGNFYSQVDGVAMGSPLGPTLANVFLCHWEEIWQRKCPIQFAPKYYKRFMDVPSCYLIHKMTSQKYYVIHS